MAQQLREQGEEILLLALLDTRSRYGGNHTSSQSGDATSLVNFARELASSWGLEVSWSDLDIDWTDLSRLKPDDQLEYLLQRAKAIGAIPIDTGLLKGEQLLKVFTANAEAMRLYVAKAYPGRVTLIRTKDRPGAAPRDAAMGWGDLAAEGVKVHTVGGGHYSMVREPFVNDLAKALSECLKEAAAQS
jgi:thioesterase domain-containing protein